MKKMTTEQLKTEIRDYIAMSEKATDGPWKATLETLPSKRPFITITGEQSFVCHVCSTSKVREDAAFIARSRNISPVIAKALLVAIEGLEDLAAEVNVDASDEALRAYAQDSEAAQSALDSILKIWEESKQ
jgi:hypothetical protein